MNLYAYVANDPVNFLDPFGLSRDPLVDKFREQVEAARESEQRLTNLEEKLQQADNNLQSASGALQEDPTNPDAQQDFNEAEAEFNSTLNEFNEELENFYQIADGALSTYAEIQESRIADGDNLTDEEALLLGLTGTAVCAAGTSGVGAAFGCGAAVNTAVYLIDTYDARK